MPGCKLSVASLRRLDCLHPHLRKVVRRAAEITEVAFQVGETLRPLARQRKLVKAGASQTLRSRHLLAPNGLVHAVDLVAMIGSRVSWEIPLYHRIADAMKSAAREMGVPLDWGGDWKTFFDGPHFQLPWGDYPGVASVKDDPPPRPSERELATLAPGAKGDGVRALQETLVAFGEPVKVDGDYGPGTRAAVLRVTAREFGKAADVLAAAALEKLAAAARKANKKAA